MKINLGACRGSEPLYIDRYYVYLKEDAPNITRYDHPVPGRHMYMSTAHIIYSVIRLSLLLRCVLVRGLMRKKIACGTNLSLGLESLGYVTWYTFFVPGILIHSTF